MLNEVGHQSNLERRGGFQDGHKSASLLCRMIAAKVEPFRLSDGQPSPALQAATVA
jgi:hypothetical protein